MGAPTPGKLRRKFKYECPQLNFLVLPSVQLSRYKSMEKYFVKTERDYGHLARAYMQRPEYSDEAVDKFLEHAQLDRSY